MRNCTTVEALPQLRGHAEENNAATRRLIPLVAPATRNRACDSPSLGPPEESVTAARKKLPRYEGKAEERLPIRGIVNSLILDQQALGRPEYDREAIDLPQYDGEAEERLPIRGIVNSLILDLRSLYRDDAMAELDRTAYKLCRGFLESDDPRKQVRGFRFWLAIKKHQIRMRELELQHAKVGIEAVLAVRLARLQLEGARSEPGATPEQVSKQVAEVLRELAASEAGEA